MSPNDATVVWALGMFFLSLSFVGCFYELNKSFSLFLGSKLLVSTDTAAMHYDHMLALLPIQMGYEALDTG
jgi:hypothetical protein